VYRFMGHGNRRQSGGSGGGMTSKEQRSVMEQFRAPGRRLLVSTSAGEEGIDVPRCELVVRYTATQTGECHVCFVIFVVCISCLQIAERASQWP
jgi:ERCC4-related helicase